MPTLRMPRCLASLLLLAPCAIAGPAWSVDSTSASFRLRFAHPASVGPVQLQGSVPGPGIGASGASLGQGEAIGPSGASGSLTSHLPGFWPLIAGGAPSLDSDGDGVAYFLDDDDDGDGLLDSVETDTGIFVSALDTGTNRLLADTDGDGASDGQEVALGTDPNDPFSTPGPPIVPALPPPAWLLLALGVLAVARPRIGRPHLSSRRTHP